MNDELRGELAEWLAYLKDIGVRELGRPEATAPAAEVRAAGDDSHLEPAAHAPAPRTGDLFTLDGGGETAACDPALKLREIREHLGECTRCGLHRERTNIVFGVGDPGARLMFIGEGPGADEDAQGEPFVGRAGQKLNDMIRAIGLERESVYIANIVKCRPPNNRDPKPEEIATCSPFLIDQIEAIRPSVIVTLGAPATRTLLGTKTGITKLRGQWHSYRGIPVMPTFHPAFLLRKYTQENRRWVWEDLKAARARMDEAP